MKVAAIVVTWNSGALLERCLRALACQTQPFDRVIVVDNDSPEYLPTPRWSGAETLLFHRSSRNQGFAAANNWAIAQCDDCDWVALVNPDAFLAPDWLACMLLSIERHENAASFASTLIMDADHGLLDGVGDVFHFSGLPWRAGYREQVTSVSAHEREVFSACAAAALYNRRALREVGGFDEAFFCYIEDVDVGFRLRLAGYECWYVPAAKAFHVGSASSGGGASAFALYHGHRNLIWCFVKNMPSALMIIAFPAHLLMNAGVIVALSMRGMGAIAFKAKWHAVKGLPAAMRSRRAVQAGRCVSAWAIWRALDKSLWHRAKSIEKCPE